MKRLLSSEEQQNKEASEFAMSLLMPLDQVRAFLAGRRGVTDAMLHEAAEQFQVEPWRALDRLRQVIKMNRDRV